MRGRGGERENRRGHTGNILSARKFSQLHFSRFSDVDESEIARLVLEQGLYIALGEALVGRRRAIAAFEILVSDAGLR